MVGENPHIRHRLCLSNYNPEAMGRWSWRVAYHNQAEIGLPRSLVLLRIRVGPFFIE